MNLEAKTMHEYVSVWNLNILEFLVVMDYGVKLLPNTHYRKVV